MNDIIFEEAFPSIHSLEWIKTTLKCQKNRSNILTEYECDEGCEIETFDQYDMMQQPVCLVHQPYVQMLQIILLGRKSFQIYVQAC